MGSGPVYTREIYIRGRQLCRTDLRLRIILAVRAVPDNSISS